MNGSSYRIRTRVLCLALVFLVSMTILSSRRESPGPALNIGSSGHNAPGLEAPLSLASPSQPTSTSAFYSFRDDFSYSSLNATLSAGWKLCGGASTSFYTVSSGSLTLENDGAQGAAVCWDKIPIGISDWTITSRVEWVPITPYELGSLEMFVNTAGHSYVWLADAFSDEYKLFRDGQFVSSIFGYTPDQRVWHTLRMDMHNGKVTTFFDTSLEANYTESDPGTYLSEIGLAAGWESTDSYDYVTVQQYVPSYPDFIVTPSQISQNVSMGRTAYFPIALMSVNSFAGQVKIESDSTLATSETPSTVILTPNGSNSSMIAISTTTALQQTYQVVVVSTSGSLSHISAFSVSVTPPAAGEDFTISTMQSSVVVVQQDNDTSPYATFTVQLGSIGNFAGGVQVLVPSIWTLGNATVSPNIVSVTPDQNATAIVKVYRLSPGASTSINIYVTGTTAGLTHTIYVEVIFKVPEFKITTVPSSIALVPGDHSSTSILVTSDFFSGAVDLRASITPYTAHELVISLDSAQVLLTSNGVGRVVLNLATSQTASPRVYTVQINGISNRHFANATMTAIVVSHPYSVGVKVGESASYALTTSNASLPQILIVLTVTSISGSNVSYSAEYYVQDHALNSTGGWIDAATGYMLQPVVPFFLAPTNLGIGDTVYLDPVYGALRITSLDRGVSAGVNRNIVRFESANPTGQTQVSWDQATGIMVSLDVVIPVNSTQLAIHYLLISTDAWTGLQMSFHPLNHVPFSTPVAFKADVDGGSSPYNYVWHFGDGSSSTEENPSHMYPKQGDYVVTVDVTDSAGNMIERSQTITIDAPSSHDIPTPITALNLLPIIGAWLRANIVLAVLIFSGAWLALSLTLAALTLRKKSPRPSS